MPGLIKIGKTKRDSHLRAKELSTTSVPTPYQVAFELFSDDMDSLEKKIHKKLADFQVAQNREFYKYPLDKAIRSLQELNAPPKDLDSSYAAVSIFNRLKDKYPKYFKNDIIEVRILQSDERVWLEITTEKRFGDNLIDQVIKRTDLAFIREGREDELTFKPENDIQINADKFVNEFDPYSIIMTTDLFNEDSCREIASKFESEHPDFFHE
jgi:hypothetical protein